MKTETVTITPDVEGMKAWLAMVARESDAERVTWGLRMAHALGVADWYAAEVDKAVR